MTSTLLRLFHLRPGELRRVLRVLVIGMAYAAAVSLGDDIAQSVFVSRVGAESLPRLFLAKGILDVVAAALYLPLTRGRSPANVWRGAILIYVGTVVAARMLLTGGGDASAYALYIGHECAWTILTIHWGVYVLDAFDASQARRLFPLLFTGARVGGILAGAMLGALAGPLGAVNLLGAVVGFALIAGALSYLEGNSNRLAPVVEAPEQLDFDDGDESAGSDEIEPTTGLWSSWKRAASSPLVRAIAYSTAAMVLVRYGMRMVSISMVSDAFRHDENMIAEFLGALTAFGNIASVLLGVLVVPRILAWLGVGFANLAYAVGTVGATALLCGVPSLGAAVGARFADQHFKDALKTPLSTLFYGAEPPHLRAASRAFVFGAVIPLATLITATTFELVASPGSGLDTVAWIALGGSVPFTIACFLQNRRWRTRLTELLDYKLARTKEPESARLQLVRDALSPHAATTDDKLLDAIALGLASDDQRLRAVAEEVLSETIPRNRAHAIVRELGISGQT